MGDEEPPITREDLIDVETQDIKHFLKRRYKEHTQFSNAIEDRYAYIDTIEDTHYERGALKGLQEMKDQIAQYESELAYVETEIAVAEEEPTARGQQAPCPFVSGMR